MIIRFGRLRTTRTDSEARPERYAGSFSKPSPPVPIASGVGIPGQVYGAAFGFGNDLLRDHHDVAIAQRRAPPVTTGIGDQRCEIRPPPAPSAARGSRRFPGARS